jgi:hypothetical protein
VDFVVQNHQYALSDRLGVTGGSNGGNQVHADIGTERARRPLRPDDNDRLVGLEHQIEEVGGLLQGRCAVKDDEAAHVRLLAYCPHDQLREFNPVVRPNLRASDRPK